MKKLIYISILLLSATTCIQAQTTGWIKVLDSLSIGRNILTRYKFPSAKSADGKILKFKNGVLNWYNDSIGLTNLSSSGIISITGTYPNFTVTGTEVDGSITDVRVLRGIGGGCDEEAIRVVKSMPRWIPGKQRGVPVRVQFNLPIKFTLQ